MANEFEILFGISLTLNVCFIGCIAAVVVYKIVQYYKKRNRVRDCNPLASEKDSSSSLARSRFISVTSSTLHRCNEGRIKSTPCSSDVREEDNELVVKKRDTPSPFVELKIDNNFRKPLEKQTSSTSLVRTEEKGCQYEEHVVHTKSTNNVSLQTILPFLESKGTQHNSNEFYASSLQTSTGTQTKNSNVSCEQIGVQVFMESSNTSISTQTNWTVANSAVQTSKILQRTTPSQTLEGAFVNNFSSLMLQDVKPEVYHVALQTEATFNSIAVQSNNVQSSSSSIQTENKVMTDTYMQTHSCENTSMHTQTINKILVEASIQTTVNEKQEAAIQIDETESPFPYHILNALRTMETSKLDFYLLTIMINLLFLSFSKIKNAPFPSKEYYHPIFLTTIQKLKNYFDLPEEKLPRFREMECDQIIDMVLFCSSNLAVSCNEEFIYLLWRTIEEQKDSLNNVQKQILIKYLCQAINQVNSKTYTIFTLKILYQLESIAHFTQNVSYGSLRDYVNNIDSNAHNQVQDVINFIYIFNEFYIDALTEDYSILDVLKMNCNHFVTEESERKRALSQLEKLYNLISNHRASKITGNQSICDIFFITYPEQRKITVNTEKNQLLIIENIEGNMLDEIDCWELIESRMIQYIEIVNSTEWNATAVLNFYVILTFVMSKSASVDQNCTAIASLAHLKHVIITDRSTIQLIFRHLHAILQSVDVLEAFMKILGATWIYEICLKLVDSELADLSFDVLALCIKYYPNQHLLLILSAEKVMNMVQDWFNYLSGLRKQEYLDMIINSLHTQTALIFKSFTSPSKEYFGEFPLVKFTFQHIDSDLGTFFTELLNICFSELFNQLSSKTGYDTYLAFCKYLSKDSFGTSIRNCLRKLINQPLRSQEECTVFTLLTHIGNIYAQTQNSK